MEKRVNRGVPLNIIQRFLRHESLKMTERYAHLETKSLRVAQRGKIIDLQENARIARDCGQVIPENPMKKGYCRFGSTIA